MQLGAKATSGMKSASSDAADSSLREGAQGCGMQSVSSDAAGGRLLMWLRS